MSTNATRTQLRWLDWAAAVGAVRVTVGLTAFSVLLSVVVTVLVFQIADAELPAAGWAATIAAPTVITPLITWYVMKLLIRIHALEAQMRELATYDPLTGLFNRRAFLVGVDSLSRLTQRARHSMALIFIDIDHFKSVNDQYGHAAGDQVIRAVARVIKTSVRDSDLCCRLGGEEFVLAMSGASASAALAKAEQIRLKVAQTSIETEAGTLHCTVSLGVAAQFGVLDPERAMADADAALYQSKRQGRNRSTLFEPSQADGDAVTARPLPGAALS